jgi:MYXO-CTERM domain-containing protein
VQNLRFTEEDIRRGMPSAQLLAETLEKMRLGPCPPSSVYTPDEPCDSDGDGTIDVDELVANQDPDDRAADAPLCVGPRYGCGAHVAPAPTGASGAHAGVWLALLATAAMLVRRRRA